MSISGYNTMVENHYWNGRGGARGVAILVKKEIEFQKIEINKKDCAGMDCVIIVVKRLQERIAVIGVYR